jgi:hypothetical protein
MQEGCTAVQAASEIGHLTVADLSADSGMAIEQIEAFEAGKASPNTAEATLIAQACAARFGCRVIVGVYS